MLRTCGRRLRARAYGFVVAGAVLAGGAAVAQIQLLEQGMKRATAGIGQTAATLLENTTLDLGYATYRMPRIEVSGSNLSQTELMALFEAKPGEPVASRLGRFSAAELRIPEIRVEQSVGSGKQITVYRDVVARDIVNGRIASLTSPGATIEIRGPNAANGSSGQLAMDNLDAAYAAALFGEKAAPQPVETKPVYGSFSLDNFQLTDSEKTEIRIGRMAGKDFRARPTAQSWGEAMRILGETPDLEKASPAERARVFGIIADLLGAYEIGSMEATGFEIRKIEGKDTSTGRIARLAYTGGSAEQPADMRAEGIEITSTNTRARISTIAFTGFSFKDSLQGLRSLSDKRIEELDAADLRRLVPTIGTMRFSGLDFDVPNEASSKKSAENIRFSIGNVEVTADKPVNGIPTNLRTAIQNIAFAVPANPEEEQLKDLAAMGYSKLDLSFVSALSWSEPASEVVVREVSVRGADMGSVVLRGVLGNVTKDVFSPDTAVAMVALVGATTRNLDLTIENTGLFERILAQEATKQKRTPEDLRREYGMAAAVGVPAMLGNSPSAKAVGQAVARFIAKPGRLNISVRTKDAAGLGIADVIATTEPAALLDKLEISATAE